MKIRNTALLAVLALYTNGQQKLDSQPAIAGLSNAPVRRQLLKTNHQRTSVDQGDFKESFPDHGCEAYHHADQYRKHRVKKERRRVIRREAAKVIEEQMPL